MCCLILIAVHFILVHGPDMQQIEINVNEISSLREPRGQGHVHHEVNCLIFMTNGQFIGVKEDCHKISEYIEPKNEEKK
jgi:hypothetical protein